MDVDPGGATWRKSSFSNGTGGECVEVADLHGGRAIRDSKHPEGPILMFTREGWRAFVQGIQAGELCAELEPGQERPQHVHLDLFVDRHEEAAQRVVALGATRLADVGDIDRAEVVGPLERRPSSAKMWPVGWEALGQWGDDVVRGERLTGGAGVNGVWSVRVNGHLAVGRLGQRSDADLAWETGLLRHLHREGMPVPVPIPTRDGRHFAGGLVVMTYVEGGSPETEADWRRVAATLRQLHRLTQGWPQRPGWRSSTDLLHAGTGTRVDLGAMPPDGVARCRAAWARLTGRTTCVVHGDPNPGNIRMTADHVAMIDWDESHVDVPDLDLALPHNAAGLGNDAYDIAAQARAAWEAAVCWDPSGTDQFAVRRLAEVRAI